MPFYRYDLTKPPFNVPSPGLTFTYHGATPLSVGPSVSFIELIESVGVLLVGFTNNETGDVWIEAPAIKCIGAINTLAGSTIRQEQSTFYAEGVLAGAHAWTGAAAL